MMTRLLISLMAFAIAAQLCLAQPSSIPSGLSRRQALLYTSLRDLLADADSRFAHLVRGKRAATRAEGPDDVKVFELSAGLPGLETGWGTDPSDFHAYLCFEGTPTDGAQLFEDYVAASRALLPGGREQDFGATNWRIADGRIRITIQRETKQPRRPDLVFQSFVLTIYRLK